MEADLSGADVLERVTPQGVSLSPEFEEELLQALSAEGFVDRPDDDKATMYILDAPFSIRRSDALAAVREAIGAAGSGTGLLSAWIASRGWAGLAATVLAAALGLVKLNDLRIPLTWEQYKVLKALEGHKSAGLTLEELAEKAGIQPETAQEALGSLQAARHANNQPVSLVRKDEATNRWLSLDV